MLAARLHVLGEHHRIGRIVAEEAPIERAVQAPRRRRTGRQRAPRVDQAHVGDLLDRCRTAADLVAALTNQG